MITKVTVLNENFEVTKTLEKSSELNNFIKIWDQKQELETFNPAEKQLWNYKLDIVIGDKSQRWLYNSLGKVTLLSKAIKPIYDIKSVADFNMILGLKQLSPTPILNEIGFQLTKEKAQEIAEQWLSKADPEHRHDFVLQIEKTQEHNFGWVFYYQTKKYLKSKNFLDMIPGTGPLVIDRFDSKAYPLSTNEDSSTAIKTFSEKWNSEHRKL